MADQAFARVHAWFEQAIDESVKGMPAGPGRNALKLVLWSLADPVNRNAVPAADPAAFQQPNVAGKSLAVAALVTGEAIAAIDPLKTLLDALGSGDVSGVQDAVKTLVQQVKRAMQGARVHPSAFALAKLVLTLTRDLETAAPPSGTRVPKLGELLTNTAADRLVATSSFGVGTLVLGAVLDTAFDTDPGQTIKEWATFTAGTLAGATVAELKLLLPNNASALPADSHVEVVKFKPTEGVRFRLKTDFQRSKQVGTSARDVKLKLKGKGELELRWGPGLPRPKLEAAGLGLALDVALVGRGATDAAVAVPDPAGTPTARIEIRELGATLALDKPAGGSQLAPAVAFRVKDGKLVVRVTDALLKQVLGEQVEVAFSLEALADAAGGFRFKDGTALRVNLPIQALPTGPFELQLLTLGVEPKDGFARVEIELSLSAGVDLGPFKGSVERVGARLVITTASGATTLAFKPPTGLGLQLDAGPVKGGGYLSLDPELGEYKGALELKLASIGVKALGMLHTKRPPGNNWSLLLLLFGDFPPIQLSWGFVLTGIGGIIGVQHTADTNAMAQRLGDGGLDAVLFPKDVAANAPQIFETLKALFPFQPGGFLIGPMLEVGWGTPTLVALRLGLLFEAGQVAMLGQLAVQVPPLVDKQLAVLRLQVDFVGVVVFDPLKIAFDGRLRDSRVGFITLTGQFAFRAAFGSKPTFLLSAGGFHPRFADIPADVPTPFERIGAGFSIGIIGVSIKGYFAVTSATVQAGCEVRAWGDVGVASFEAGLGFDAICYLAPKFRFEVDFRAWAEAEAFGIGFGVRLSGMLAGPGRWHIRGTGEVDLGWFGSVSVDFDERWGEDRDTPKVTRSAVAALLAETAKRDNWSVQLPADGEHLVTVRGRPGSKEPLGHPLASLVFTQRTVPLNRRLDHLGEANIEGARTLELGGLTFGGAVVPGITRAVEREHFAASQFFKLSEDERLTMPSFERMDAGERLGTEAFEVPPTSVRAPVDWETRDLSPEPANTEWTDGLLGLIGVIELEHPYPRIPEVCDWMIRTGAAGRSVLRANQALRPADAQPLVVQEQAPAVVARKRDEAAVGGVVAGAWEARQQQVAIARAGGAMGGVAAGGVGAGGVGAGGVVAGLGAPSVAFGELQVIEEYELV
jgi:hypothetical protein